MTRNTRPPVDRFTVKLAETPDTEDWRIVKFIYARNVATAEKHFARYAHKRGFTTYIRDYPRLWGYYNTPDGSKSLVMS